MEYDRRSEVITCRKGGISYYVCSVHPWWRCYFKDGKVLCPKCETLLGYYWDIPALQNIETEFERFRECQRRILQTELNHLGFVIRSVGYVIETSIQKLNSQTEDLKKLYEKQVNFITEFCKGGN